MSEPAPKPQKKRKFWINLLKTILTLILLAVIINQLRHISLRDLFSSIHWSTFILACFLFILNNAFGAWRWKTLAKKFALELNLFKLLKYYYIGNFVSFFLPTSIGGDVARMYFLQRDEQSIEIGSSTVIIERILGILAIFVIFSFSMLLGLRNLTEIPSLWSALAILALFLFAIWVIFYFPAKWFEKLLFFPEKVNDKLRNIFSELQSFKKETVLLIKATILSVCFQLMMILSYYFLAASIDLSIPFRYFLLFMPLIWILSLLPISLNGLGVREGSFVYLFSSLGYPSELVSLVSVLGLFILIVQGLMGGIIFLFEKGEKNVLGKIGT